jgi:serine/threonine-protein kinase
VGTQVDPQRRCQVCGVIYAGPERFCSIDGGAIVADGPGELDTRLGSTIDGRYLVRRFIGKGGMGTVYEADHIGLDKPVAIKFLAGDEHDADALARFRREARIASRIVHEHVVHIYDVGTYQAHDYIVMELVAGRDLREALSADGPFDPARAIHVAVQLLRGLHAVHKAGIVHRDIKPANILLTERDGDPDFVKLMDFGISKAIAGDRAMGTLTETGKVIGTPQFMAPEQLASGPIDHRADLYAVGLTLFAMLVGEAPFAATSFTRVAGLQLGVEAPSLDALRPGLPPALVSAVARVLAKSPGERYADAAVFADALEGIDVEPGAATASRPVPVTTLSGATVPASGRATPKPKPDRAPPAPRVDEADRGGSISGAAVPAGRSSPVRWIAVATLVIAAGVGGALWYRATTSASAKIAAVSDATVRAPEAQPAVAVAPPIDAAPIAPSVPAIDASQQPVVIDAGVRLDAGAPPPRRAQGSYCLCQVGQSIVLCPKVVKPMCSCRSQRNEPASWETSAALCAERFVPCTCAPDDKTCIKKRCDPIDPMMECPNRRYVRRAGLHYGEDCRGFHPLDNSEVSATLSCDMCPGVDRRTFDGAPHAVCEGYNWGGMLEKGTLQGCDSTKHPFVVR